MESYNFSKQDQLEAVNTYGRSLGIALICWKLFPPLKWDKEFGIPWWNATTDDERVGLLQNWRIAHKLDAHYNTIKSL